MILNSTYSIAYGYPGFRPSSSAATISIHAHHISFSLLLKMTPLSSSLLSTRNQTVSPSSPRLSNNPSANLLLFTFLSYPAKSNTVFETLGLTECVSHTSLPPHWPGNSPLLMEQAWKACLRRLVCQQNYALETLSLASKPFILPILRLSLAQGRKLNVVVRQTAIKNAPETIAAQQTATAELQKITAKHPTACSTTALDATPTRPHLAQAHATFPGPNLAAFPTVERASTPAKIPVQ